MISWPFTRGGVWGRNEFWTVCFLLFFLPLPFLLHIPDSLQMWLLLQSHVCPACLLHCSLIKFTSQNIPNSRIMSSSMRPPLAIVHSTTLKIWAIVNSRSSMFPTSLKIISFVAHMLNGWFKKMYYGGMVIFHG